MLNKLHSFAYELFVLQLGLFVLVGLISLIGDQSPSTTDAPNIIKFVVSLNVILAWSCLRNAKANEHSARLRPIWCGLARKYVILRALSTAFLTFSTLWLAFMVFVFARESYSSVILTISNCAYRAGAYESAEWWYKQKSDRGPGNTVSTWKILFASESERERTLRNDAVAVVYGVDSLEIARRYFLVGRNVMMYSSDYQNHGDEALSWFQKSYAVSQRHHYDDIALDSLCQMSMVKYDHKNTLECHSYLIKARELMSRFPEAYSSVGDHSRYLLGHLAGLTGDQGLATTFQKTPIHVKSHDRFLDATKVAILFALAIVPPLCSRLGLISPLLTEVLIVVLYHRSRKRLMKTADLNTSMATLNRLIDLDLYRGNYSGALRHSEFLLQLASFGVIACESTEIVVVWRDRIGLLLGQQFKSVAIVSVVFVIASSIF